MEPHDPNNEEIPELTRTDAWVVTILLVLGGVAALFFVFSESLPGHASKDERHLPRCLPAQDEAALEEQSERDERGEVFRGNPCPPTSLRQVE